MRAADRWWCRSCRRSGRCPCYCCYRHSMPLPLGLPPVPLPLNAPATSVTTFVAASFRPSAFKTALIYRALERFARPAGGFLELIADFIRRVGDLIADRTEMLAFERGSRKCRSDSRPGGDARDRDRERLILQDAADGAFKCRLSLLRNTRRLFANRAACLASIVRSHRRDRPGRIHGSVGDVARIFLRARHSLGKAAASALS